MPRAKELLSLEGAEEEHYDLLGKNKLRLIINVQPEENDTYDKLENLLANKYGISKLPPKALNIKKHHCPIKVAKECLDFWEKN